MLQRDVAIKLLLGSGPHDRERFTREARTLAGLSHPNIVGIFEFAIEDHGGRDVPYLVMEFIEGDSLRERTRRSGKDQILRWLCEVADGLAAVHQAGVVHRDLKPANIMIGTDNRARIVDFGLAKSAGSTVTTSGTIVGTVDYFSPEQTDGLRRLDYRTDIFSFGVVLYEAFTGKHPFRRATDVNTMRAIHLESTERIPGRIGEIVARCLQKRPTDRYDDAADIARDLREFQPASTRETTSPALPAVPNDAATVKIRSSHGVAPPLRKTGSEMTSTSPLVRKISATRRSLALASIAIVFLALAFGGGWLLKGSRDEQPTDPFAREGSAALRDPKTLGASTPGAALFSQKGPKLIGTGAVGYALQGSSVALSAAGNTLIVGGWGDNGGTGAAWVWTREGDVWTQDGPKLVGSGGEGSVQGTAVALSADGDTAIVGGSSDGSRVGAVWIWTRKGGAWRQQGPKLVGSGFVGQSYQGAAVALSADGNTAIVGGWLDNDQIGAVWIWTRSGDVWTQDGPKLVPLGAFGQADYGYSVALSADGKTALVGGHADDDTNGAVWPLIRQDGRWSHQGTKLIGTDAMGPAFQGVSVSLSADGNTALVGGRKDNNFIGAAWIWTRSKGGVWSPYRPKLVGSGFIGNPGQGFSVCLSADGMTALVGGISDNSGAGGAWVWRKRDGVWHQRGPKLLGAGSVGNANQGKSLAISADGNTAAIGGFEDDDGTGAVWIFMASEAVE